MAETPDTKIQEISEEEFLKSLNDLEDLSKSTCGGDDVDETTKALLEKSAEDEADDDDEKEESEAEGEETEETDEDDEETEEKSFASQAADESEEIRKAIEVSEFLGDLVKQVGDFLDSVRKDVAELKKSVAESASDAQTIASAMSKAFGYMDGQLRKSLTQADELRTEISTWGDQPARPRKSQMTVLEKSFDGQDDGKNNLSKNQIISTMTEMLEKNVGGIMGTDVIKYESTGVITPQVLERVREYAQGK